MTRSNKKGYTLLELVAVIAIIVILAGAATFGIVSSITHYRSKADANAEHNAQFEGLAQEELNNYSPPGVNTATPTPKFTPTPPPSSTPFPTHTPTPVHNTNTPTPGGGGGGGGSLSGSANLTCWNDTQGALTVSSSGGGIQSATVTFPAGYTLQILGQRDLPPTVASLLMSLESVFSALAGFIILHQTLSVRELIGCALVFTGVILAQIKINNK